MDVAPACSVMVRDTRLGQRVLSQAYETLKAWQSVLDLRGILSNAFLLTNQILIWAASVVNFAIL